MSNFIDMSVKQLDSEIKQAKLFFALTFAGAIVFMLVGMKEGMIAFFFSTFFLFLVVLNAMIIFHLNTLKYFKSKEESDAD